MTVDMKEISGFLRDLFSHLVCFCSNFILVSGSK